MFAEGGMLVLLDREVLGSVVPQDAFRELCNTLQFREGGAFMLCGVHFSKQGTSRPDNPGCQKTL